MGENLVADGDTVVSSVDDHGNVEEWPLEAIALQVLRPLN